MATNKHRIVARVVMLLFLLSCPPITSSLSFIKNLVQNDPKSEVGQGQIVDMHGQIHQVETPELLASKHKDFISEFAKLPDTMKKNAILAQEKCSAEIITGNFIRMFLRSELFQADLAAIRYAQYWEKRVEHFGPVRAFQPLTIENMKDDMSALNTGFINVIERNHNSNDDSKQIDNRTFLYIDPSKQDRTKYTRESMIRAVWFIAHKVLEECEEVQKRGFICLAFPKNTRFAQVDLPLYKELLSDARNCLPVRVSAVHICHPPPFFRFVWPIVSKFMSKRIRQSVQVHAGNRDEVIRTLQSKFGFENEYIPVDLDGTCSAERYRSWIEKK